MNKHDVLGQVEPSGAYRALTPNQQEVIRERLKQSPLVDFGHGRWTRTVAVEFTATIRCCMVCDRVYPMTFMLSDELWLTIVQDKKDVLCFRCAETRMGRPITPADLSDAECNCELSMILETK